MTFRENFKSDKGLVIEKSLPAVNPFFNENTRYRGNHGLPFWKKIMKIFILPHVLSFTIRILSKKLFFWIFAPKVYGYLKVADIYWNVWGVSWLSFVIDKHWEIYLFKGLCCWQSSSNFAGGGVESKFEGFNILFDHFKTQISNNFVFFLPIKFFLSSKCCWQKYLKNRLTVSLEMNGINTNLSIMN